MSKQKNQLYLGDNLWVLREYVQTESVDLIYLDPPFNSNRNFVSQKQTLVFEDTWDWNDVAKDAYQELLEKAPDQVSRIIKALYEVLNGSQMMAYLVMMTVRLLELYRVLKPTGSLYLHCDPTASHFLRVILDIIFGPTNFGNEIIWKRFSSHGNVQKAYGKIHDAILWYRKSKSFVWNQVYRPLSDDYIDAFFKYQDENGRKYRLQNVLNPNKDRPNLTYEWNGHVRVWKWTREKMKEFDDKGLLVYSKTGLLKGIKQYLDESKGQKIGDLWDDIRPLGQTGEQLLDYPTQKPISLLERIIETSSNENDVVLDPFCGCGATIHAAEKLCRAWIGIDITTLSISILKYRLKNAFALIEGQDYDVTGEPKDLASAEQLAKADWNQFRWWALSLIQAKAVDNKNNAIDGVIDFIDDATENVKQVIVHVTKEKVTTSDVRLLLDCMALESAAIGVLITMKPLAKVIEKEASAAGFYFSPGWNKKFPKIQTVSIEQLLKGKKVEMPPVKTTFKKAKSEIRHLGKQRDLWQ